MVYMGSKSKYAGNIVPILQRAIDENHLTTYIEPFVGGANIIDKIHCQTKYGYDKNAPLIALHQQMQKAPNTIPMHGDAEWWYAAKDIYRTSCGDPEKMTGMELWKIGAIAFYASFSNGGFSRGYAKNSSGRDYYNEAFKNHFNQGQSPLYQDIRFQWVNDYTNIQVESGSLIYCDPPYQNTKPYGYKFETGFDYSKYWDWVRALSQTNIVICSEQTFPDDFHVIWTKDVKRTCGKDNNFAALEKLGIYKHGLAADCFINNLLFD